MKIHVCQSIRGAIWNRKFAHFQHNDGRPMTPLEAFHALCDELAKGHEVVPVAECDNFDFTKGCLGHPETLTETLTHLGGKDGSTPLTTSHPLLQDSTQPNPSAKSALATAEPVHGGGGSSAVHSS